MQGKKKQSIETIWVSSNGAFSKDLKTAIVNMSKELKKAIFKELKERMTTMNAQIRILN